MAMGRVSGGSPPLSFETVLMAAALSQKMLAQWAPGSLPGLQNLRWIGVIGFTLAASLIRHGIALLPLLQRRTDANFAQAERPNCWAVASSLVAFFADLHRWLWPFSSSLSTVAAYFHILSSTELGLCTESVLT
jgi:hypothetical protein